MTEENVEDLEKSVLDSIGVAETISEERNEQNNEKNSVGDPSSSETKSKEINEDEDIADLDLDDVDDKDLAGIEDNLDIEESDGEEENDSSSAFQSGSTSVSVSSENQSKPSNPLLERVSGGIVVEDGVVESFDRLRTISDQSVSNSVVRLDISRDDNTKLEKMNFEKCDYYRIILFENPKDRTGFGILFHIFQRYEEEKKEGSRKSPSFHESSRRRRQAHYDVQLYGINDVTISEKFRRMRLVGVVQQYTFQFENDHDYSTFDSFLRMILKDKFPKKVAVGPKNWSSSLASGRSISRLFQTSGAEFFQKPASDWNSNDTLVWMKHVFHQDPRSDEEVMEKGNSRIITLYEKLVEVKHIKTMEKFVKSGGGRKASSSGGPIRPIPILREVVGGYPVGSVGDQAKKTDLGEDNIMIKEILEHESIRTTLSRALFDLECFGDQFSYPFHMILKKRIDSKSKPKPDPITKEHVQNFPNLQNLRRYIKFRKSSWWKVDECSFEVLFLLLFNRTYQSFQEEHEEEFEELKFRKKNTDFKQVLDEFNGDKKLKVEWLSFDVNIQLQIYSILRKIYIKEAEKKKIRQQIQQLQQRRDKTQKLLDRHQTLGKYPSMIKETERRLNDLEKKVNSKRLDSLPKLEKIDTEVAKLQKRADLYQTLDDDEMLKERYQWTFVSSKQRHSQIKSLIKQKIDDWGKATSSQNFSLTVKLVLGRLVNAPGKMHKIMAKYFLPIVGGEFYRYGFTHASLVIKNCQVHWFNSSLIHFKELKTYDRYREFFCCDVDCPLVCNYDGFSRKIRNLAETMVKWNTYYRYVPFKIMSGIFTQNSVFQKNCQEFTTEMLNALGATKHRGEVEEYLNLLKRKLENDEKLPSFQFFTVNQAFFRKFQDAFQSPTSPTYHREGTQKNPLYTVYFKNHEELDDFVLALVKEDPSFAKRFPGSWVLLKAFDRGYILRERKDPGNPDYTPSKCGCPFNVKSGLDPREYLRNNKSSSSRKPLNDNNNRDNNDFDEI